MQAQGQNQFGHCVPILCMIVWNALDRCSVEFFTQVVQLVLKGHMQAPVYDKLALFEIHIFPTSFAWTVIETFWGTMKAGSAKGLIKSNIIYYYLT